MWGRCVLRSGIIILLQASIQLLTQTVNSYTDGDYHWNPFTSVPLLYSGVLGGGGGSIKGLKLGVSTVYYWSNSTLLGED